MCVNSSILAKFTQTGSRKIYLHKLDLNRAFLLEILQENIVGNSAGNLVGNYEGNLVGNLVGNSVGNLAGKSVGNLVGNSVGNSVGNLMGSSPYLSPSHF